MIKEQIKKFKDMFNYKDGTSKKKIENLVVFIIILIITIIGINIILNDDSKNNSNQNILSTKVLAQDLNTQTVISDSNKNYNNSIDLQNNDDLKSKLEEILSKIEGVGDVKVLITYSQTNQFIPVYNEDNSSSSTEEKDTSGGSRIINESNNKKEVIYQEVNGEKIPVTQTMILPKIEGALVTAKGAKNSEIKLKITQAVEAATGLPTHKIQVFEMV